MAKLVASYMTFYVQGRDADELDDDDKVDVDDLADQLMKGTPVRDLVDRVAQSIAAPLEHDRERKEWVADNEVDITAAGGDKAEAYRHYLQGLKDAYAHELEERVIEATLEEDDDLEDEDEDENGGEDEEEEDD